MLRVLWSTSLGANENGGGGGVLSRCTGASCSPLRQYMMFVVGHVNLHLCSFMEPFLLRGSEHPTWPLLEVSSKGPSALVFEGHHPAGSLSIGYWGPSSSRAPRHWFFRAIIQQGPSALVLEGLLCSLHTAFQQTLFYRPQLILVYLNGNAFWPANNLDRDRYKRDL